MPFYLSDCLSVCLSVSLFVCLFVYITYVGLFVCMFVCLSVCLAVCLSVQGQLAQTDMPDQRSWALTDASLNLVSFLPWRPSTFPEDTALNQKGLIHVQKTQEPSAV